MNLAKSKKKAILTLLILSPIVAELILGSTPLFKFINPISLFIQIGIYGSVVVLLREIRVRWKAGMLTMALLGITTSTFVEGYAMLSFFNPYWPGSKPMGFFGYWHGVAWIWVLYITVYHAVESTLVPTILAEHLFPDIAKEPWVTRKSAIWLCILCFGGVIVGHELVALLQVKSHEHAYFLTPLRFLFCTALVAISLSSAYACRNVRWKPSNLTGLKRGIQAFVLWLLFFATNLTLANRIPPLIAIFLPITWFIIMSYPLVSLADAHDFKRIYPYLIGTEVFFAFFTTVLMARIEIEVLPVAIGALVALFLIRPNRHLSNLNNPV